MGKGSVRQRCSAGAGGSWREFLPTPRASLLKWEHHPERRSGSWRGTIREQRRELRQLLESGTLRRHAEAVLADAYAEARRQAADETELPLSAFPVENRWGPDELLAEPNAEPS